MIDALMLLKCQAALRDVGILTNYEVGKFPFLGLAALLLGHLTVYFSPVSRGSVFQTSASSLLQHSSAFVLCVCLILSHRMEDCLL